MSEYKASTKQPKWPYYTKSIIRHPDFNAIETVGREIIARAVANGRLVAFIGSGVSMAFGRPSWRQLVDAAIDEVFERNDVAESWKRLLENELKIDRNFSKRYFDVDKALVILQLCRDALDESGGIGLDHVIDQKFRTSISAGKPVGSPSGRHSGHGNQIAGPGVDSTSVDSAYGAVRKQLTDLIKNGEIHISDARLRCYILDTDFCGGDEFHSNDDRSSLSILLHKFGIRRFATTNFDGEIEAALECAQYKKIDRSSSTNDLEAAPQDECYETLDLHSENTGEAIVFSVEGKRRHAAVLHLHGSVMGRSESDKKMLARFVASEKDYQRHYLQVSRSRDLLDNTVRALFGANPVLYVGAGLSEDDVLRPLRELMSQSHKRFDRLGVALLPADKDKSELFYSKIDNLIRHGIYVIHYGFAKNSLGEETCWLANYFKAVQWMKKTIRGDQVDDAELNKVKGLIGVGDSGMFDRDKPVSIEGQSCTSQSVCLDGECAVILRLCKFIIGLSENKINDELDRYRFNELLDEISHSVISNFLRARLLREASSCGEWRGRQFETIKPMVANPSWRDEAESVTKDGVSVYLWRNISIQLVHDNDGCDRFLQFHEFSSKNGETIGLRWQEVMKDICGHDRFVNNLGRRLVFLPVPRGVGKGSMFDQLAWTKIVRNGSLVKGADLSPSLREVYSKLSPNVSQWHVALVSLNFLSDVSNLVEFIANVIYSAVDDVCNQSGDSQPWRRRPSPKNLYGYLECALDESVFFSSQIVRMGGRVLVVLANIGVLFDKDGRPKNGQVIRILKLLTSLKYESAPIDYVMFCDEDHVPYYLRVRANRGQDGERRGLADAATGPFVEEDISRRAGAHKGALGERSWPAGDASSCSSSEFRLSAHYERRTRLAMKGVVQLNYLDERLHVYPPQRCKARDVALPFLLNLYKDDLNGFESKISSLTDWRSDACWGRLDSDNNLRTFDEACKSLSRCVDGCRIVLTIIFAYCEELSSTHAVDKRFLIFHDSVRKFSVDLFSPARDTPAESALHVVFDRWKSKHLRGGYFDRLIGQLMNRFCDDAKSVWELTLEILWHLSIFSHPVEDSVLIRCPGIVQLARKYFESTEHSIDYFPQFLNGLVDLVLKLCIKRCLVMRMSSKSVRGVPHPAYRYTVHRIVQRYFIKMMGGRDVEGIEWDQFSTSLYTSQPDEIPALDLLSHNKVKKLIKALCRYPSADLQDADEQHAVEGESGSGQNQSYKINEFQALRAAYFVARSTYSVGVLSHIAHLQDMSDHDFDGGHMEEYRRLIRWITHRADALGYVDEAAKSGYFFKGEIVWLYSECGVMSLMQGKLEDADSALRLALKVAKLIECDDTGSFHVRLLLHVALVSIERGKPHAAKNILVAIANRKSGHDVPPLIAEYYLGMIDHLAGAYHAASDRYEKALQGFRALQRNRAAALVLRNMADLHNARYPDQVGEAMALATEAMVVAQRGGHEDVRVLASLTLVKIRTNNMGVYGGADLFKMLEAAEQYGRSMGMPRILVIVHEVRSALLLAQGETRLAAKEATSGAEIAALYDMKLYKVKALLCLARVYVLRDEILQAKQIVASGKQIAQACEYFSCLKGFRELEVSFSTTGMAG